MSDHPGFRNLVSVVLPTYHRDEMLAGALRSVVDQTYGHFEVIVSDSAASDATARLVADFGDKRVRYRRNDRPLNLFGNHLAALQAAEGSYIAVLHDDDLWEPGFLARLVDKLDTNPECVLAFCDQFIIDAHGRFSQAESDANSRRWGREGLAEGVYRPFWRLLPHQSIKLFAGTVFRRDALPAEIPTESGPALDLWLAFAMCSSGAGAYYVPERLMRYRYHDASDSAQPFDLGRGYVWVWENLNREPGLYPFRRITRFVLAEGILDVASRLLHRGDAEAARLHALAALRHKILLRGAAILGLTLVPRSLADAVLRYRSSLKRPRGNQAAPVES